MHAASPPRSPAGPAGRPRPLAAILMLLALAWASPAGADAVDIDDFVNTPSWSAESNQAYADFGASVSTAGDVNGDGFSDVIAGAYLYDALGANDGAAIVYLGTPTGLDPSTDWSASGGQDNANFGLSVSTAGDVNGDGYDDVIIGAPGYDDAGTDRGRAYVYFGSPQGLSNAPDWTATCDQAGGHFGFAVSTAGDVDGDGYDDVLVGAFLYDDGESDEGVVYLYLGGPLGLSLDPDWTMEGNANLANFGFSLGPAGDVNGDGYADVIIGAPGLSNGQAYEGRAYLYLGSPSGLSATASWTAESDQDNARLGWSVGTAGDVNGDGYADVIVGANYYDDGQVDEGAAFVYLGSADGLAASPVWSAEGDQAGAEFGTKVATAGDMDGDGYADVIVGAPKLDFSGVDAGVAFVYAGGPGGPATAATWSFYDAQAGSRLGYSVGTAGDVNGDGFNDAIAGAYLYQNGQPGEGAAFVYNGTGRGLDVLTPTTVLGPQGSDLFGAAVASAGDVNGDGYSDFLVGSPFYDSTEFPQAGMAMLFLGPDGTNHGTPDWTFVGDMASARVGGAVAGAGDVNGDGFADVIISAPGRDNGNGLAGRSYVFYGSAGGLSATPDWFKNNDQQFPDYLGAVAGAGDVNGDGFADVIIGVSDFTDDQAYEGRAALYLGSAAGLATSPAWTREGNQDSAAFGASVSSAGDVNRDGYSDVIVGAPQFTNTAAGQGRAFLYFGSASGLGPFANWYSEAGGSNAHFGASVACAGDVNGDGYSDVIVGAPRYQQSLAEEGAAFVYYGSPTGLSLFPDWWERGYQPYAWFGVAVASAGDANGDGFSDIAVGERKYIGSIGKVWVYRGSATGVAPVSTAIFGGEQLEDGFGTALAPAGDVNGDGFADLLIGAPYFDDAEPDQGKFYLSLGCRGGGPPRVPRQRRFDDSGPIALLGLSDSGHAVRIDAIGRSAAGRDAIRLQFEVKPRGTPFDGSGLVAGPVRDTGAPGVDGSAVQLADLAGGLDPSTLYHWRLRTISRSVYFPRSRWLSPPGNAPSEADLRTSSSTGVAEGPGDGGPLHALLDAPAPNPFTGITQFAFTLPARQASRLAVYDVSGRLVTVLQEGARPAGRYAAQWDGRDAQGRAAPSGVYFVRLETGGRTDARKLVLLR